MKSPGKGNLGRNEDTWKKLKAVWKTAVEEQVTGEFSKTMDGFDYCNRRSLRLSPLADWKTDHEEWVTGEKWGIFKTTVWWHLCRKKCILYSCRLFETSISLRRDKRECKYFPCELSQKKLLIAPRMKRAWRDRQKSACKYVPCEFHTEQFWAKGIININGRYTIN